MFYTEPQIFPDSTPDTNIYAFLISPSQQVSSDITEFKKIALKRFGPFSGAYSKPHITLFALLCSRDRLEKIFDVVNESITNATPFQIELEGFGHFESAKTIYVNVKSHLDIIRINKGLKTKLFQAVNIHKTVKFYMVPHMTIARRLSETQFKEVWHYFRQRKYFNSFLCDRISGFKVNQQDGSYKFLKDFSFNLRD